LARSFLVRRLAISRARHPPGSWAVADAIFMATAYDPFLFPSPTGTRELLKEAIAIYRNCSAQRGPEDVEKLRLQLGATLQQLATVLWAQGDLPGAISQYREALEQLPALSLMEKEQLRHGPTVPASTASKADWERFFEAARREEVLRPRFIARASLGVSLANTLMERDLLDEAKRQLDQLESEDLAPSGSESKPLLEALPALKRGMEQARVRLIMMSRGECSEAALRELDRRRMTVGLIGAALDCKRQEWLSRSSSSILGIAEDSVPPGDQVYLLVGKAYVAGRQNMKTEALSFLDKGRRALASPSVRSMRMWPSLTAYVADAYGQLGRPEIAVRLLRDILSLSELDGRARMDLLRRLAANEALSRNDEKATEAMALMSKASLSEFLREVLFGTEFDRFRLLQSLGPTVSLAIELSMRHRSLVPDALNLVLNIKGRISEGTLGFGLLVKRDLPPELRAEYDQLIGARGYLARLSPDAPEYGILTKSYWDASSRLASVASEHIGALSPVSVEDVDNRMPNNALLLEYIRYSETLPGSGGSVGQSSDRYALFAVAQGKPAELYDLGEAGEVDKLVERFQVAVTSWKEEDFRPLSRKLFERILGPIAGRLRSSSNTILFISPDSELNVVPFAALVTSSNEYLVETHDIAYLSSGRELATRRTSRLPQSKSVLVLAPAFDVGQRSGNETVKARPSKMPQFDNLSEEAAARHASMVREFFSVDEYPGALAQESALKGRRGEEYLHIYSHAEFAPDGPREGSRDVYRGLNTAEIERSEQDIMRRSRIALAGANIGEAAGGEDGILTALEVSTMDLRGTRLVLLAACKAANGAVRDGDGVAGLRSAFAIAGSETQVLPLWEVASDASTELVRRYYDGLANGLGRATAMSAAQRLAIKSRMWSGPYFWGAFIVSGDWTPVPTPIAAPAGRWKQSKAHQ